MKTNCGMYRMIIVIAFVLTGTSLAADPIIPWGELKNPMQVPIISGTKNLAGIITDNPGLYYENGWYYVYLDNDNIEDDNRTDGVKLKAGHAMYKTKDFKSFTEVFYWHGGAPTRPKETHVGSSDLVLHKGTYYQTYQCWDCVTTCDTCRSEFLLFAYSNDLNNWSTSTINLDFAKTIWTGRDIDPALAFHNTKVYLTWKDNTGKPAMAVNTTGDPKINNWNRLGQPKVAGNVVKIENMQMMKLGNRWRMIGADTDNQYKFAFLTMKNSGDKDSDWLDWERANIDLPNESGMVEDHFRSVYLADWRFIDGYFYAIWASNYLNHKGFGGIIHWARSKDLKNWFLPGNVGKTPNSVSSQVPPDLGTGAVSVVPDVKAIRSANVNTTPDTRLYTIRGQEIGLSSSGGKIVHGIMVQKSGSKISKSVMMK